MKEDLQTRAIQQLAEINIQCIYEDDIERLHAEADGVVFRFLREAGYTKLADEYGYLKGHTWAS